MSFLAFFPEPAEVRTVLRLDGYFRVAALVYPANVLSDCNCLPVVFSSPNLTDFARGLQTAPRPFPRQQRQLALVAGKISVQVRRLRSSSVKVQVLSWLLLLCFPTCQLAAQGTSNAQKFSPPTRTFRLTYNFTVKDIPSGAKRVRVWIPVPQTDQHQTVRVLAVKAPGKTRMTQEPEYGNRMMYAEIENSAAGKAEFTLEYKITRREYSRGDYAQLKRKDLHPGVVSASMSRLVEPDALIPTDGRIKELAVEVTGSQTGAVAKAKAAYDYLFTNMRYDKTGSGWGRGDAVWACDSKRGNCTDFHSPFIGMLRADGIPARFDIGFLCPKTRTKEISPVITAGLSSTHPRPAGFPLTSQRRGKRRRTAIISSAALTPIACSCPPAATSHCLPSRMVRRLTTSSIRMLRSTVSRTTSSTSSSPLRK